MRLVLDELLTAVSLSDPARGFYYFDPIVLTGCGSLSSTQLLVLPSYKSHFNSALTLTGLELLLTAFPYSCQ